MDVTLNFDHIKAVCGRDPMSPISWAITKLGNNVSSVFITRKADSRTDEKWPSEREKALVV